MDWQALIDAASEARKNAHVPYSGFAVGAALETGDGSVFVGCNVENRSFGATLCAERVAAVSALAAGHDRFQALAVVADTNPPALPCGLCLQTLAEFADSELPILLVSLQGERVETRLGDLLPHPFAYPTSEKG